MCLVCIDISKGLIKTRQEAHWMILELSPDDQYNVVTCPTFNLEDEDCYKPKDEDPCSCGAKYTSVPGYHLRYCKD